MHNRRRLSPLIICLLLALGATQMCRAQNPPQPLPMGMVGAAELTPQQLEQITVYVKFFGERLNSASEPAEVESARAALIAPLNQPNAARLVSPVFRLEYSKAATPEMQRAFGGADLHRAVNALLVLSQLGESRAADAVLQQAEPAKPWQVRLQAASALRVLLQGGALDPKRSPQVAKRVRDAAAREDNGLVLAHLLAAIDAASETVQPEFKEQVRGFLVDAMVSIADRLAQHNGFAGPTVDAFVKELDRFHLRFRRLPGPEQASLGKRLAPALGKVLAHILTNWDAAQADQAKVERLVGACETFLQFINISLKGAAAPEINLRNEWSNGDKAKFEAGVTAWQDLLNKPPYT